MREIKRKDCIKEITGAYKTARLNKFQNYLRVFRLDQRLTNNLQSTFACSFDTMRQTTNYIV